MTSSARPASTPDYGPRRLTVELTNRCNLHCSYCLRDEDALHHDHAAFLPVDLFARAIGDARELMGIEQVMFTGGEPTLHPRFGDIIAAVADQSLKCSFVTNGWHFDRVWPLVSERRETVTHVAFSLDGVTREAHDRWRGAGSFVRVVRAFSRCWAGGFPFKVKVVVRRDTAPQLEGLAIFAARLGAAGLSFAHVMPTSTGLDETSSLSLEERAVAEREIAQLARILRIPVGIDVGYCNMSVALPPASRRSGNIDYRESALLQSSVSGRAGSRPCR